METMFIKQEVSDVVMRQGVLGVKGQCSLVVPHGIRSVAKETVDHTPVSEGGGRGGGEEEGAGEVQHGCL